MAPEWNRLIEKDRLYRPKELGGKSKGERGFLGMSSDSVIRKIVNGSDSVIAKRNSRGTYRSPILIPGWVVLIWIDDNLRKREQ